MGMNAGRILYKTGSLLVAALLSSGLAAKAEEDNLVVLELFTSQSCYSCPPAERLLAEHYLGMEGVLALEMHVDYWDDLIYGIAGKWKDIWSKPEYTQRQYAYNNLIRGRRSAYTPQFVVSGAYEAGGTNKGKIDDIIGKVRANRALKDHSISVRPDGKGRSLATISGPDLEGKVFGIVYERESVTEIEGGENKGKILTNHNVVKRLEALEPSEGVYILGPIDPATEGCVFIVQDRPIGVIRAAARCASG